MGSSSGFPIDLVLFGMIAAFLVLRLRSILGKRTGIERPPQPNRPPQGIGTNGRSETRRPSRARRTRPLRLRYPRARFPIRQRRGPGARPDAEGRSPPSTRAVPGRGGAGLSHDRGGLRGRQPGCAAQPALEDTFRSFETAIAAREAASQTQKTEIRAINAATIEAAALLDRIASVTVRFVSDQISVDTGKGWAPGRGNGRGDGDHRSLDVRARPVRPRPDLAADRARSA